MSSIIEQLGPEYFSLEAARVDASPTEFIITNDETTYYIITPDVLTDEILDLGYKKVEDEE